MIMRPFVSPSPARLLPFLQLFFSDACSLAHLLPGSFLVRRFLVRIEDGYRNNPYHNR